MTAHTNKHFNDSHFLESFVMASLRKEFSFNFYLHKEDSLAINLFNDSDLIISGYFNSQQIELNHSQFKELFKDELSKCRDRLISMLVSNDNRLNTDFIIERNIHNINPKHVPSFFEAKYKNLYFIYNAGVHQIVRLSKGRHYVTLIVQLPSGRLHQVPLSLHDFLKRPLFVKKELALNFLLEDWILYNEIPFYRKNFISSLKS